MINVGGVKLCLTVLLCAFVVACGGGGGGSDPGPQTQPQTIQFTTTGPVSGVAGTSVTNLASGGAGTGAITYQSSSTAVSTIDASTGVAALLSAGSTTITATKAPSSGFTAATASYTLNVTLTSQTIQFATPNAVTGEVGTQVTNVASGGAGTGAITYQSSDASVATVDASTALASLIKAGTTTITATKAASASHSAATASYTLNVALAPQTIQFATTNAVTGEIGTQVSNVASGGTGTGAITYQSSDASVATVNASTGLVSLIKVGTATITATKAASASHSAATASYFVTATQGAQSIQFASGGPIVLVLGSNYQNTASGGVGTGAISYTTSNSAVATVNATTGAITSVGTGTAIIVATKAADANYRSAQTSYTLTVTTANTSGLSAWIGATGTQALLPTSMNGKQLGTARIADCSPGDTVIQCAGAQQHSINGTAINDTRATLTNAAYYEILDGSNVGPAIEVTNARFSQRIGHATAFFKGRYWVIGGGEPVMPGTEPLEHTSKADVWSSPDGRTWKLETNDGGFGARWFHQVVVYNNRMWIISGAPAPITNLQMPWLNDMWSSTDGINWQLVNPNQYFPWNSTDLNVVVFNNEMLAVSGGQIFTSTNGIFAKKPGSATPAVTTTTLGRTHATLTVYNNELWYIGGKLDYPITQPPNGDAMNDIWKSSNGTTWTQVTPNAPFFSPRYRHSAFVANGRLWVLGGQGATAGVAGALAKDAWSTEDGINWTQEDVDGIARGYLMQGVQESNKVTLIGGIQYSYSNNAWQTTNGANWVELSSNAQFSMRHTRGVTFNGQLWIVGGQAVDGRMSDSDTNDIWRSADGVNWSRVAPNGPVFSPRDGNGIVVFNGRLWVIGGWSNPSGGAGTQVHLRDVWSSADGVTWRQDTLAAPFSPRVGHHALAFGGKLWVIGGYTASGSVNDVWSSDDGVTWNLVTASAAFTPRISHRVVEFNNAMWLIAGNDGTNAYNDIWRSTDGAAWTQITPVGPVFSPRTRHAIAVLNSRLYVVGGITSENFATGVRFNDVWSSADGITWQRDIEHAPFAPRSLHALMVHQNQLWIVAGLGVGLMNDAWRSSDGVNWRVGYSHDIVAP